MGSDIKKTLECSPKNHARMAVENSVNETTEMFSLLVSAVNDYAIFAMDINGHILTWNTGARRLKGYEASEIIGSHFSRFYTPEDISRKHPDFELKQAIKNGSYEEEGWRIGKNGKRFWANIVITTLYDSLGIHRGFSKVTRDLTERKIATDKLQSAYETLEKRVEERTAELAQAKEIAENAVKARDEFLSIASHELRTPLTSLKLQIQMRKRALAKQDFSILTLNKLKTMADDDDKQINRITRLVDDMLDITQITSGKMSIGKERTDLNLLVSDVLRRFEPQFEENKIRFKLIMEPNIYGIWDQYRIEQVFTNLLTNAIKYGDKKDIEITVKKNANFAILIVRDNGIGIKLEDHARIFQQFERAVHASDISGLGLGLYIVKKIIDSHKGTIQVESGLKKGSSFIVHLPI